MTCLVRIFSLALLWVAAAEIVAADGKPAPAGPLEGKLHISDCIPGGEAALRSVILDLAAENPELEIAVERTEPALALEKLAAGETDLVLAPEPLPEQFRNQVESRRYAAVTCLVFVNASNSKRDFTDDELRAIFSGELGTWQSLNGSSYSLHRLALQTGRPPDLLFRAGIMPEKEYTDEIYRKPDSAQLLVLVAINPNAVALTGYPGLDTDANVVAAAVNGIAPVLENLKSGRYPLLQFRLLALPPGRSAALVELLKRIDAVSFRTALLREELFTL